MNLYMQILHRFTTLGHTREVEAELGLKLFDAFKDFFKRGLLDAGEFFGIDVVIRFAVFFGRRFDLAHKTLLHEVAVYRIKLLIMLGGNLILIK